MIQNKFKLIIAIIIFILVLITMQLSIYATNEKVEIVKKSDSDYLIYVNDNSKTDFEFAFSNNENADKELLTFKKAETDSKNEHANKIAFINSTTIDLFKNPTYLWVKNSNGTYIIDGLRIDLSNAITEDELINISNITKRIPVDTNQTNTTETNKNDKKITTTIGKVVLQESKKNYQYIIVKLPYTEDYEDLMQLATTISKFNNETDVCTKINIYKTFGKLVENLKPNNNSNWINVENNEIEQPNDAEDGTQYVLWIKEANTDNSKYDIQFLTSNKDVVEEKITEKITTKLPVTYDNNILLVVLAILIIIALVVIIRIVYLTKKEQKN